MNIYELMRAYWDFAFEHPDEIKPKHAAIYFFAIDLCNRLGWRDRFRLGTTMTMEACGIHSYNTYKRALEDIVSWGGLEVHEWSKNQYSSTIVALSKFDKAKCKALDKALKMHMSKHDIEQISEQMQSNVESTDHSSGESTDSIIRQVYKTTNLQSYKETDPPSEIEEKIEIRKTKKIENQKIENQKKIKASRAAATTPDASTSDDLPAFEHVPLIAYDEIKSYLVQKAGHTWKPYRRYYHNSSEYLVKQILIQIATFIQADRLKQEDDSPIREQDKYDFFIRLWHSETWWMKKNKSLKTLHEKFDEIVNALPQDGASLGQSRLSLQNIVSHAKED